MGRTAYGMDVALGLRTEGVGNEDRQGVWLFAHPVRLGSVRPLLDHRDRSIELDLLEYAVRRRDEP
jgi:hypothetical protein